MGDLGTDCTTFLLRFLIFFFLFFFKLLFSLSLNFNTQHAGDLMLHDGTVRQPDRLEVLGSAFRRTRDRPDRKISWRLGPAARKNQCVLQRGYWRQIRTKN